MQKILFLSVSIFACAQIVISGDFGKKKPRFERSFELPAVKLALKPKNIRVPGAVVRVPVASPELPELPKPALSPEKLLVESPVASPTLPKLPRPVRVICQYVSPVFPGAERGLWQDLGCVSCNPKDALGRHLVEKGEGRYGLCILRKIQFSDGTSKEIFPGMLREDPILEGYLEVNLKPEDYRRKLVKLPNS